MTASLAVPRFPVVGAGTALADVVDVIAARTGSWLLVEQSGRVIAHGVGARPCPPILAEALLTKRSAPLRSAVSWRRRRGGAIASLDGRAVATAELGDGCTVWVIDGRCDPITFSTLRDCLGEPDPLVVDPLVAEMLQPRGPSRPGRAPIVRLLVVRAEELPTGRVAGWLLAAVAGLSARVHCDDDRVVVALEPHADAEAVLDAARVSCPTLIAGCALVASDAVDWVIAADLAEAALAAAHRVGRPYGDPDDVAVAAQMVVQHATAAAQSLEKQLGDGPVQRLREHDARLGSSFVDTLLAWCASGFDTATSAAALHIHCNTLRYRLRRAGDVCGLDLGDQRSLLALQLLLAA